MPRRKKEKWKPWNRPKTCAHSFGNILSTPGSTWFNPLSYKLKTQPLQQYCVMSLEHSSPTWEQIQCWKQPLHQLAKKNDQNRIHNVVATDNWKTIKITNLGDVVGVTWPKTQLICLAFGTKSSSMVLRPTDFLRLMNASPCVNFVPMSTMFNEDLTAPNVNVQSSKNFCETKISQRRALIHWHLHINTVHPTIPNAKWGPWIIASIAPKTVQPKHWICEWP